MLKVRVRVRLNSVVVCVIWVMKTLCIYFSTTAAPSQIPGGDVDNSVETGTGKPVRTSFSASKLNQLHDLLSMRANVPVVTATPSIDEKLRIKKKLDFARQPADVASTQPSPGLGQGQSAAAGGPVRQANSSLLNLWEKPRLAT
jgi:hypothetical protein